MCSRLKVGQSGVDSANSGLLEKHPASRSNRQVRRLEHNRYRRQGPYRLIRVSISNWEVFAEWAARDGASGFGGFGRRRPGSLAAIGVLVREPFHGIRLYLGETGHRSRIRQNSGDMVDAGKNKVARLRPHFMIVRCRVGNRSNDAISATTDALGKVRLGRANCFVADRFEDSPQPCRAVRWSWFRRCDGAPSSVGPQLADCTPRGA